MSACFICDTPDSVMVIDEHHLIKRSQGGYLGPTIPLCRICHDFLDNGLWEMTVNGEALDAKNAQDILSRSGYVTIYRQDTDEEVVTISTPRIPLEQYGVAWRNCQTAYLANFAMTCELAYIIRRRTVKDAKWMKARHGRGDWAVQAASLLSEYSTSPLRPITVRERALVWDRLSDHGDPTILIHETYGQLRPIDFIRAVHYKPDTPLEVLDWILEQTQVTQRLPTTRETAIHFGAMPMVRPTWGPGDTDLVWRLVYPYHFRGTPTTEETEHLLARRPR